MAKPERSNMKPGDRLRVNFAKKEYEGTLLESPEEEKNVLLLKLDSGYNIGLNRKEILSVELLKKASDKKESEVKKPNSKDKPNIGMIITGGTIASRLDPKTGAVDSLTKPEEFFKFYPELFEKVNISRLEIPFMKSSEDMDYKDWQKIAKSAVELLNDSNIQGIIITHGTDFLHYTSSALSFFLKDLNKPVVLTYSQRSIDRASSDANLNLKAAALVAISDIAEVMLVGHGNSSDEYCLAMPGNKVRKLHSSKRDAFKVVNCKPYAKIFPNENKIEIISGFRKRNKNKVKLDSGFEEKVALLKVYPGQDPSILDFYKKQGYKGIVLEMSGLGHVPTHSRNSWLKKLKEVTSKGMIVVGTTQTIFGRVDPYVYSNARETLEAGVIYLEDMLSETAFVKLGYVLAKAKNKEEAKRLMLTNMAGEFNDRLEFEGE